uniref:Uncharacterized protein n=1 Tax=Setaria italica TaxID=4555 RepID=K3ZGF3_SETIT
MSRRGSKAPGNSETSSSPGDRASAPTSTQQHSSYSESPRTAGLWPVHGGCKWASGQVIPHMGINPQIHGKFVSCSV